MATSFIGIKFGSSTTWIYKSGNGLVLREPSLVAVTTSPRSKEVKAVGQEAKNLVGRSDADTIILSPIQNGTIVYEDFAVTLLKSFLKKIFPIRGFGQKIKAILCVPLGISAENKKIFEITCFKAGISDVFIVPDIMAYAIGSEINLQSDTSHLLVTIGGDTTSIAVISGYSIIKGYSFSIGGSLINVAISKYIEEAHSLKITLDIADHIKKEICSLLLNYSAIIEVTGINTKTKLKGSATVSATELFPIIEYYYNKISQAVLSLISSCEQQTIMDISKEGIYYFGGATAMVGFERYMLEKTGYKVNFYHMTNSNIIGVGELIKYPQILKRIVKSN